MSNEFDNLKDDNLNLEQTTNLYKKEISSAGIQTAKMSGFFHNERIYSNMLSMVNYQKEKYNTQTQFKDDMNNENQKLLKKTHSKYSKFVTFIKQRHFKTYSSKIKKFGNNFQEYNNDNTDDKAIIHKKNQLTNLFLTQEIKKNDTKNNKILLIYKKIFDRGLEEAKVYSNIKLVPLIEKDMNDVRPISEIDTKNDKELNKAINFHKYTGPKEDQNSKLMKKRGFLNFHTNPAMKKGLHLLYRKTPKAFIDENLKLSNEKVENPNNTNIQQLSNLEKDSIKMIKKYELSKENTKTVSIRNSGLREKLKSSETKNRSKIYESKSDPIDDRWLIKVVSSKCNNENNFSRFNKYDYKFERVSSSIIRSNSKRKTVEKGISSNFEMIVQNYQPNIIRNINKKGSDETINEILTNSKAFNWKSNSNINKSEVSNFPISATKNKVLNSSRKISTSIPKIERVKDRKIKQVINNVLVKEEADLFFNKGF